jgi:hypothetical protein
MWTFLSEEVGNSAQDSFARRACVAMRIWSHCWAIVIDFIVPKGHIHSVTIKFPNWRYYNNTTKDIYRGWTRLVRENVYLYDMQVSTCLVYAYEDYSCFGEVSFFRRVEGFKMERRAAIKFCVKWKKTATETSEMLRSA